MTHSHFVVLVTALVVAHVLLSSLREARHLIRQTRSLCAGKHWRQKAFLVVVCAGTCAVLGAPVAYYGLHLLEATHAIV